MAWNEPGKNGDDKDPWKRPEGKDQGPPDLDEVFRGISDKLGGVFGGGKGSNNGGSLGSLGVLLVLLIAGIVWAFSGFYTIKEAEKGVVLRFGQFNRIVEPGLNWRPALVDKVISVDVNNVRFLPAKGFMLTQDENVVSVEFEIQYRVVDPVAYKFSVTDADDSLQQAVDSALRYVIGHSIMDDVLTRGRETVRQETWKELEKIIAPYNLGLAIQDVNFKDARPPEEVKSAFDDAIAAQEDEERFVREAEAYARELEPRARGQVSRILQEANAYRERIALEAQGEVARFEKLLPEYKRAPEVTRSRLYLDAMEQVLSNSSKVVIDNKGTGNMMYLPLDKMIPQNTGATTTPTVTLPSSSDIQKLRDQIGSSASTDSSTNSRADRFSRDRFGGNQ